MRNQKSGAFFSLTESGPIEARPLVHTVPGALTLSRAVDHPAIPRTMQRRSPTAGGASHRWLVSKEPWTGSQSANHSLPQLASVLAV